MLFSLRKYVIPLIHFIIWIFLFLYPFLFHYIPITDVHAITRIFIFLVLIATFFYSNTFILIPKILGSKKIIYYLTLVTLSIILISFASGYLQFFFNPDYIKKPESFRRAINTGIISSIMAWVISSGMKVTSEWFRNQQLMKSVENEKLIAELNFLKSQVNPHFLFNALNNIYALENKKSPDTGFAILKLSELVRYMLYETSHDYVSLEKEIDYLVNYIELQKLSLNKEVKVDFKAEGDLLNKKIEPMLLIPLVENVFKHGISYKSFAPVFILLKVSGNKLELITQNALLENKQNEKSSYGIGLVNLKKRLSLLYPGNHEFKILKENEKFIVHLSIILK